MATHALANALVRRDGKLVKTKVQIVTDVAWPWPSRAYII